MSAKVRMMRYRWKLRLRYPILCILLVLLACYAVAMLGCSWVRAQPDPPMAWEGHVKDGSRWSLLTRIAVDGAGLSEMPALGLDDLCPHYDRLALEDRGEVWAQLISVMSRYESGFDPNAKYVEPDIKDRFGNHVISSGLLQISLESALGYGCKVTQASLFDPAVNLACGVRILARNVQRNSRAIGRGPDGRWQGGSAYWSVLRVTNGLKPRASYAGIRAYMSKLELCTK